MAPPLIIPRRNFGVRGVRKRTLSQQIRVGMFLLMLMMLVLFCVIGFLFLQNFNTLATKGYEVRKLENERMKLVKANEINDLHASEARTLGSIMESDVVQRMVRVDDKRVTYIKAETGVAKK